MSLKSIKGKIRSVNKTRQVTRAMEAVSAAKMRKSQEQALRSRPFAVSALRVLSRLSGGIEEQNHPLVLKRDVKKTLVVLITSDRGLAGNLNNAALKKAQEIFNHAKEKNSEVGVVAIGRKGYEYSEKRGHKIVHYEEELGDKVEHVSLQAIARRVIELYLEKKYDEVFIVYTNFISTFEQEPISRKVLPLSIEDVSSVVKGIKPARGKYADLYKDATEVHKIIPYLYEPSAEAVFGELAEYLVSVLFFHALLEAKASEFSARMMAMRNASDKAGDLSRSLLLKFNKVRQSAITREVSEIIGGIEALAV